MSRHTLFKKSLEEILERELTNTEKRLVVALSLIRKSYDDNYDELVSKRRLMIRKYGYDSTMRRKKLINKNMSKGIRSRIATEEMKDNEEFHRLLYLETQLFQLSKYLRRGTGFELLESEIPKDKKEDRVRRDTAGGSNIRKLVEALK